MENVKEYMDNEIKKDTIQESKEIKGEVCEVAKLFGEELNIDLFKSIYMPTIRYKRMLLVFDTKNRDLVNSVNGKLVWNVSGTKDYRQGTVNSKEELRNIVGMRIYPFRMRVTDCENRGFIPRWMLLIEEFQSQACIMGNGNKYHFITTVLSKEPQDNPIYYNMTTHNFNQGYFWFRLPITVLNSVTLVTYNVLGQVNISIGNGAVITGQGIDNTNPLEIDLTFFPDYADFIQPGDIIRLSNFTCDDPVTNQAIILQVNSYEGGFTEVLDGVISVPIDCSAITLISEITIEIIPKRMQYPIEFIYTG